MDGHVRAVARRLVPADLVDDATAAGLLGLLAALDFYGRSRRAFWAFACRFVREAIEMWCEVAGDAEALRILSEVAAETSPDDRRVLFSEHGRRPSREF